MRSATYTDLDASAKSIARQRISGVLDKMARESGRICVESSSEVASRASYTITRHGYIWGLMLPGDVRWLR